MSEKSFRRRHSGVLMLALLVAALAVPNALSLRSDAREVRPAGLAPHEPVLVSGLVVLRSGMPVELAGVAGGAEAAGAGGELAP